MSEPPRAYRWRQRRPALVAAAFNALLVGLLPFWWQMVTGPATSVTVTPEGVSRFNPGGGIAAVFGVLIGFRTLVHAVNYLEGDAGWRAVLEPAVPGFLGPLLMLGGLVANRPPHAAVGYVGIYAALLGGAGLLVGIVLRFTAVAAIHVAGGARGSLGTVDLGLED
ncbi:MAG: hypothetical protein ABMA15_09750 [Vicinamibacterales bacterium]